MDIIITHENSDFDAFASTVAAQLLYPEATIVLGRRVARDVRDFLALHKDRFRSLWASELDMDAVTSVIIVDVRRADRLGEFGPLVEKIRAGQMKTIIYDHHAATREDLVGTVNIVEPVGSATTLLVEEIQRRDLKLDRVEATLMALGIYTDTGSLSYASTTARDAHAVGWLLEQGARLKMVNRYLRTALSTGQREVLSRMLGAVDVYDVCGVDVGLCVVPLEKNISGLAMVTRQVLELEGHDALFALYPVKKKLIVIGRSSVPYLDVGALLEKLGGGGHAGAAAATLKNVDTEETREKILHLLQANPPRPRVVRDIMSSPVHTLPVDATLHEARVKLEEWNCTGVPVVREGKLVGMISRRDLASAERGGRMDLSLASCMAHNVRT